MFPVPVQDRGYARVTSAGVHALERTCRIH
jgi:hypothetical protein